MILPTSNLKSPGLYLRMMIILLLSIGVGRASGESGGLLRGEEKTSAGFSRGVAGFDSGVNTGRSSVIRALFEARVTGPTSQRSVWLVVGVTGYKRLLLALIALFSSKTAWSSLEAMVDV